MTNEEKLQINIQRLEVGTKEIENDIKLIFQDIEDFEGECDELLIISSTLDRIIWRADDLKAIVDKCYDYLEKE